MTARSDRRTTSRGQLTRRELLAGTAGAIGAAVLVAGCAVMLLAALTLVATAPRLWRAALVQGVPPLVAIGALLLL